MEYASDYLIGAIKNYEQNGYDRKGVQHKSTNRLKRCAGIDWKGMA
jgi:hypothetical protein